MNQAVDCLLGLSEELIAEAGTIRPTANLRKRRSFKTIMPVQQFGRNPYSTLQCQ